MINNYYRCHFAYYENRSPSARTRTYQRLCLYLSFSLRTLYVFVKRISKITRIYMYLLVYIYIYVFVVHSHIQIHEHRTTYMCV